jgi:hypothetical protein
MERLGVVVGRVLARLDADNDNGKKGSDASSRRAGGVACDGRTGRIIAGGEDAGSTPDTAPSGVLTKPTCGRPASPRATGRIDAGD